MKRRLILHMGLPKTGSTSIQSFLRHNPAALAASGVHYPFVRSRPPSGDGGNYVDREISHALLGREIKRKGHARDPTDTPLWSTALRRIEESEATGIISYEHFSTQPRLYRYGPLRPRLAGFDVVGFLYLREPEAWAVSLYGQFAGRPTRPTVSFGEFLSRMQIDGRLSRLLDTIRSHAPLDRLMVADFAVSARRGLIGDFLARFGIAGEAFDKASEHPAKNTSPPPAALLFLLGCNRANLPDAVSAEVRKALGRAVGRRELPDLPAGLDLAAPEDRRRLREAAADDAERLERIYGVAFERRVGEPPDYRRFAKSDFAAIAECLAPRLSSDARSALGSLVGPQSPQRAPSPRPAEQAVEPDGLRSAEPLGDQRSTGEAVRLVVWDLDETFWRGTLSEGGIAWREDTAQIVIELARRGVMSTICSKNDHEAVEAILFEHGLWNYFIFPSIDWRPKGPRIRELIESVQLRPKSVLFIDDNPHNLREAQHFTPSLQVASETIISGLLADPRLRGKDDAGLTRLDQYKVLEARKADEARLTGAGDDNLDFLRASDIRVRIETDIEAHIERAVELINRTNQLNFTKWRLPEDPETARAKLRSQIAHFATQAGLIEVSDKYGDYGYCGYFQVTTRREVVQLQHFCFSCRILGMGIEAFVYQRLGRPALETEGEVLSNPIDAPPVDWIGMNVEAGGGSSQVEPVFGSFAARGGCVLWPLTHYFGFTSTNVIGEFNIIRNDSIIHLDHSLCLRQAILGVTPEQLTAVAPLGYVAEDFQTRYFDYCGEKPLWVLSTWADSGTRVLRHRRTGIAVPFPPPKSEAEAAIHATLRDYLDAEFVRFKYDEAEFKSTMDLVFSRVPPNGLMFVLLSETKSRKRQEANRWLREAADGRANIRLMHLRKFIDDEAEIHNDKITHFDRKVYHRLYRYMRAEAEASLAEDREQSLRKRA